MLTTKGICPSAQSRPVPNEAAVFSSYPGERIVVVRLRFVRFLGPIVSSSTYDVDRHPVKYWLEAVRTGYRN